MEEKEKIDNPFLAYVKKHDMDYREASELFGLGITTIYRLMKGGIKPSKHKTLRLLALRSGGEITIKEMKAFQAHLRGENK